MNKFVKRTLICALILFVLLFADQLTKAIAEDAKYIQPDWFLGLVKLDYVQNSGIAFGIGADSPYAMAIFTPLTIAMILGIGVLFFTVFKENLPAGVCLAVIESGAIGNLIDRLILTNAEGVHYVRDFLSVTKFLFIPAYTCNFADICIVFGAIALVVIILFIGPQAAFPLKKSWRKEAERLERERKK